MASAFYVALIALWIASAVFMQPGYVMAGALASLACALPLYWGGAVPVILAHLGLLAGVALAAAALHLSPSVWAVFLIPAALVVVRMLPGIKRVISISLFALMAGTGISAFFLADEAIAALGKDTREATQLAELGDLSATQGIILRGHTVDTSRLHSSHVTKELRAQGRIPQHLTQAYAFAPLRPRHADAREKNYPENRYWLFDAGSSSAAAVKALRDWQGHAVVLMYSAGVSSLIRAYANRENLPLPGSIVILQPTQNAYLGHHRRWFYLYWFLSPLIFWAALSNLGKSRRGQITLLKTGEAQADAELERQKKAWGPFWR